MDIESILEYIFKNVKLDEYCVIECYPHIKILYENFGSIDDESIDDLDLPESKYHRTQYKTIEYI